MRPTLSATVQGPGLRGTVVAAVALACLGLRVDPSVFYERGAYFPAFHYGTDFLRPFLAQPGGVSRYVAAYLAQACANRWLGAGVLTALAGLLGLGCAHYLRHAGGPRPVQTGAGGADDTRPALPWGSLASLAALLVWTRYGFHLQSVTALTLVVVGAGLYAHPRLDRLAPWLRAGLGLGACAAGYWACAGAVCVGALLGAAVERRRRQQSWLAAAWLVAGLLIPFGVGHLVLGLPRQEALTRLLPYSDVSRPEGGLALLLLYAVVVAPALALLLGWGRAQTRAVAPGTEAAGRRPGWNPVPPPWRPWAWTVVAAALVVVAWPPETAGRMTVMKHCRDRDWQRLLAVAERLPPDGFTLDVSFAVNQALYHTGRLGEDLFAFPQGPLSLNLGIAFGSSPNEDYYRDRPRAVFDLGLADLEMGLVNSAEHLAHEALAVQGPHPTILKHLVLVNLAKRRPEVAAVFLRSLCLDPVARPWAQVRLAALDRAPEVFPDAELIAGIQANRPTQHDLATDLRPLEASCRAQLDENPRNRMACEFLLAQYLINRNLEGFVQALPRLEAFGETGLPRHYQEALVLYELQTRKPVAGWSSRVTPPVRERFGQFSLTVAPFRGQSDPGPALAATTAFRDTYFYYYVFRPMD